MQPQFPPTCRDLTQPTEGTHPRSIKPESGSSKTFQTKMSILEFTQPRTQPSPIEPIDSPPGQQQTTGTMWTHNPHEQLTPTTCPLSDWASFLFCSRMILPRWCGGAADGSWWPDGARTTIKGREKEEPTNGLLFTLSVWLYQHQQVMYLPALVNVTSNKPQKQT